VLDAIALEGIDTACFPCRQQHQAPTPDEVV
jgi:hypothetical protein